MNFISEHPFIFAWSVILVLVFISVKGLKGQKDDIKEIKNWSSRDLWKGELTTASLLSWKQTKATHNFDYFYILTFKANIFDRAQTYSAAGVVKASEISKLKSGLKLTVKYKGKPPTKMAVVDIDFD